MLLIPTACSFSYTHNRKISIFEIKWGFPICSKATLLSLLSGSQGNWLSAGLKLLFKELKEPFKEGCEEWNWQTLANKKIKCRSKNKIINVISNSNILSKKIDTRDRVKIQYTLLQRSSIVKGGSASGLPLGWRLNTLVH